MKVEVMKIVWHDGRPGFLKTEKWDKLNMAEKMDLRQGLLCEAEVIEQEFKEWVKEMKNTIDLI